MNSISPYKCKSKNRLKYKAISSMYHNMFIAVELKLKGLAKIQSLRTFGI